MHIGQHPLQIQSSNESIWMVDHDLHSYVPIDLFVPSFESTPCIYLKVFMSGTMAPSSAMSSQADESPSMSVVSVESKIYDWQYVKSLVNRAHRHVCVHATYADIRTFMIRNKLWSDEVQQYLSHVLSSCSSCKAWPSSRPKCIVSKISHPSPERCSVHQWHEPRYCHSFYAMDTAKRYSSTHVVKSTSLSEAVLAFE